MSGSDGQDYRSGQDNRKKRSIVPRRRMLTHSLSTDSIRTDFRHQFLNRLRVSRSRSVDRLRQIVENYGDTIECSSVTQMRDVLRGDPEANAVLREAEVRELLNDIERELAQVHLEGEASEQQRAAETETEDIVDRHLVACNVCGTMNAVGIICETCTSNLGCEFNDA